MRFRLINITIALVLLGLPHSIFAIERTESRVERTIAVAANVRISACVASGNINVHGWDRQEVRARSDAESLELRNINGAGSTAAASHLEVLLSNSSTGEYFQPGSCEGSNDLDLDVPRDAVLQLTARDGNVTVVEVAEIHSQSQSGDVQLERISRVIVAGTLSGDISAKNSNGTVNLHSVSGNIQAINLSPLNAGDNFQAKTVSGDITLDHVGQGRVDVGTVSGDLKMTGPLSHSARYGFQSMSGDVILNLPADASFQINARISAQGEVTTDFPLKLAGSAVTDVDSDTANRASGNRSGRRYDISADSRHFAGIYGTGDSSISVSSFSGTLYLRRK